MGKHTETLPFFRAAEVGSHHTLDRLKPAELGANVMATICHMDENSLPIGLKGCNEVFDILG